MALLDEILERVPAEVRATRDAQAIADVLNVGRTRLQETVGGIGTVLKTLGSAPGGEFLNSLEAMAPSYPAVKWGLKMIEAGTFDFSLDESRVMIDMLIPEPNNELMKSVALAPDPAPEFEVRCAIWADDGEYLA